MDRRSMLKSAALAAATLSVAAPTTTAAAVTQPAGFLATPGFLTTKDHTQLFYKDWCAGKPVVFVSAWDVSVDFYEYTMIRLVDQGARCIGYDRRGHGRSADPGRGYDFETLTEDLKTLIDRLDLSDVALVAHSMGAGEAVRYLARHGSSRVSHLVLIAPITPFFLKTADNPDGVDAAVFEKLRATLKHDRAKWLFDNSRPFVTPETSDELIAWSMRGMLQSSLKAMIDCNRAFTETDFRPDCRAIQVPTLILQGDKDMSTPLPLTGRKTADLIRGSVLKVYEGGPHGLPVTHADRLSADIMGFISAKTLPAK